MGQKPGLRPDGTVGEAVIAFARDILTEARAALDDTELTDAVAVHDFRKAMKRWRALMRLLQPSVGDEADASRIAARDLARELAPARDAQTALDALTDIAKASGPLSPRSIATIRGRLEALKQAAETTTLTDPLRERLGAALSDADDALARWPLHGIGFDEVAVALCNGYRRVRRAVPNDWPAADPEELHTLRQRVVVHRYQMELVEPLWPRLGKVWVGEAQRLRERLGTCQDLAVLTRLTDPHGPLARWRARLTPAITARHALHVDAAQRLTSRMFAESPRGFRRRLEALWESGKGGRDI
jgi:CHAD domain-containing protein